MKYLFLRAWIRLLVVDLGLRLLPFGKLRALLRLEAGQVVSQKGPAGGQILEVERKHAWKTWQIMDKAARHHLYEMTCLRRSLVLQWLLLEEGFNAELKIGVRKEEGALIAHAWVELGGEAVGDQPGIEQEYAPLVRLGAGNE